MSRFRVQPVAAVIKEPAYDKDSVIRTTSMLMAGMMVRHSYEIVDEDRVIDKCIELAKRIHDRINDDFAGKIQKN